MTPLIQVVKTSLAQEVVTPDSGQPFSFVLESELQAETRAAAKSAQGNKDLIFIIETSYVS